MSKGSLIVFFILSFGIFFSCNKNTEEQKFENSGELKVLSSFSIITDMAKEIGGEKVIVHNLVPVGMAPHAYDPKPADVKFASDADLILSNGMNLEGGEAGWLMKLANSIHINHDKIFEVTHEISPLYLTDEKGGKEVNPHAFISPKAGIKMAMAIEKALIKVDPENKDFYSDNFKIYLKKLKVIEEKYTKRFSEIPQERKILVASEQAFQYLTKDYGLKEGYIWAIDTDNNGSPSQIMNTIDFVKENKPPILFVESNVDRRPMEKIAEATGIPVFEKPIFSDELGKPGQPADTYIKYLEYNLEVIYSGLTGDDN